MATWESCIPSEMPSDRLSKISRIKSTYFSIWDLFRKCSWIEKWVRVWIEDKLIKGSKFFDRWKNFWPWKKFFGHWKELLTVGENFRPWEKIFDRGKKFLIVGKNFRTWEKTFEREKNLLLTLHLTNPADLFDLTDHILIGGASEHILKQPFWLAREKLTQLPEVLVKDQADILENKCFDSRDDKKFLIQKIKAFLPEHSAAPLLIWTHIPSAPSIETQGSCKTRVFDKFPKVTFEAELSSRTIRFNPGNSVSAVVE